MRADIKASLLRYGREHRPTGDFLRAVLENNFMEAVGRADEDNRRDLYEIAEFVYNNIPSICHGSPERVSQWLKEEETSQCSLNEQGE